uniref:Troponin I n=1 Tax=Clastoptera arizonana TaxID=38151 RepID=A0A1B6CHI2_9HEMI
MADDEAKKAKQAEIDRKRAEVRKRMEEASKAKKAKKGFMTPDRKKKLRLLLRKKAAEELKKEQERKAAERRRIIEERCGTPKDLDDANEEVMKKVLRDYHERINRLEDQKFDLEYLVKKKDFEISDLNSQVNDLRGKFVKPTLKKVSKYENKFAKLQKKAAEFNFRNQLKVVKKKEFTLEEEDKEKNLKTGIVDWSKKDEKKAGEAPPADGEAPPAEGAPPGAEGAEGEKPAEGAPAEGAAPKEGEGAPAEGAVPKEGEAAAEGEKPPEGAEGQPAEGQPAEGQPAEEQLPPEPPSPAATEEEAAAPPADAPPAEAPPADAPPAEAPPAEAPPAEAPPAEVEVAA